MKNNLSFILNGEEVTYSGNPAARLLDALRGEFGLTGTKCSCLEGECGACSVIIDGKLRNSCLVAMGSLAGSDVVTIEGYSKTPRFAVLDEAYKSVSAVQCGFCIPGMILASECLLAANPSPSEAEIRDGISGNLCRCTGYNAIVKAIGIAAESSVWDNCNGIVAYAPFGTTGDSLAQGFEEALALRKNRKLVTYCGGTDLMAEQGCEEHEYLFLGNIPELRNICQDEQFIRFGSACTFTEVMEHELTPGILREMCAQIAAPAIRNAGTLGGNIGNGSAKADSALVFTVANSKLRLVSTSGERIIPIRAFYHGNGRLGLAHDELIAEILMPKHGIDNYYLKKVGARDALAISRVSFAGIADIQNGIVKNCAVAIGAVTDTIIRCEHIDRMLIGKTVEEAKALRDEYLSAYEEAIVPRRGRVGAEYRKDVCMNLLRDFFDTKVVIGSVVSDLLL